MSGTFLAEFKKKLDKMAQQKGHKSFDDAMSERDAKYDELSKTTIETSKESE